MPPTLTYPGVYVQEVPSGVRTIVGVSTSTALFVGSCTDGPLNEPVLCHNITDFLKRFSDDSTLSDLPRQVKLFFQNGGTTCYVMRIASGAKQAAIQMMTEGKNPANSILLTARNHGLAGDQIRAAVDYDTDLPESTFNIELFRWHTDPSGNRTKQAAERWRNLSMNPASPNYAPAFLTQTSRLVDASYAGAPVAADGFSQSGRAVDMAAVTFAATWQGILTSTSNRFEISVGGSRFVPVDLSAINLAVTNTDVLLVAALQQAVRDAFAPLPTSPGAQAKVTLVDAPSAVIPPDAGTPKWIRISATQADVVIRPSVTNDIAVRLMLGTAQGGYEVGAYSALRPAPTGTSLLPSSLFGATKTFAALDPAAVTDLTIDGVKVPFAPAGLVGLQTLPGGPPGPALFVDADPASPNGHGDGIREKLRLMARYVADYAASTPTFPWRASVWGHRLNLARTDGADNAIGALAITGWTAANGFADTENARYYSLGTAGVGPYQTGGVAGDDGQPPKASDYEAAYLVADREIDIFNLLVLPAANGVDQRQLWGPASVFCNQRRAFLVMDAPPWADVSAAKTGVDQLRIGLVKSYAAVYHPRLTLNENGLEVQVGPSGAIAGLMARTDSNRGVWKAPAGTEADIRGVVGLERRLSDLENGDLNPKAINTLRVFPSGVVCWGARTMDGDDATPSDFKYVPIRRLSLYIEESLYRGLKWVVFEPNDEPLWAQIRLNVGAFMHGLFTEGAFQGKKSTDAYFVRCDAETTSQDDRNKGIVNIWVGFAPLKPAEFVVLYLQQMAGQIAA
jgi:hypothetical protein